MEECIEVAYQCAQLLAGDLRTIHKFAVNRNNDALLIVAMKMIQDAEQIKNTLAQLKNV
jgi:hypothetical protein